MTSVKVRLHFSSSLLGAALLLCATSIAGAQWVEKSSAIAGTAAPGLVHRRINLENSSGETAQVDLAIINFRRDLFRLRLLDNADGSLELAGAMRGSGCLAGTNGGYFDPAFAPMGLRIANGGLVRPLRKARLLTGIILAGPGSIRILRPSEYSPKAKVDLALQCGPLLVDAGRAVRGLEPTRRARRTVALVTGETFALGICSAVSLAGAGEIFSAVHPAENMKVSRALNLDGGSSTAFWFKSADGKVFSEPEIKTVRDFLGIAPR